MMTKRDALKEPSIYFRSNPIKGNSGIDPEGGDFGQGVIKQASIITLGEAIGHDLWADSEFLDQVNNEARSRSEGVKVRFTHPGLSGDGLAKRLGRAKGSSRKGDRVFADIHFTEASHNAPSGDLAKYAMLLARDEPGDFGMSIVFSRDLDEEDAFREEHEDRSPDEDNVHNLRHARLAELRAADMVDEPAANPNGLFHHGDEIAKEADGVMEYALGLTDRAPVCVELDMHPDRIRGFAQSFLDRHGLQIVPKVKELPMSNEDKTAELEAETQGADVGSDRTEADDIKAMACGAAAEQDRFTELSGEFNDAAFVAEQFSSGATILDARQAWTTKRLNHLETENKDLKKDLETAKKNAEPRGHKGVDFGGGNDDSGGDDFVQLAKARAKENGTKPHEEMSKLAIERPDLAAQYQH